jgi:site-specific recombinase XerD
MTCSSNRALLIRRTKFGKSRLIPLHSTVRDALDRYLNQRRGLAVTDDHVFLSAGNRRIASSTVNYTFRHVVLLARVAPEQTPPAGSMIFAIIPSIGLFRVRRRVTFFPSHYQ